MKWESAAMAAQRTRGGRRVRSPLAAKLWPLPAIHVIPMDDYPSAIRRADPISLEVCERTDLPAEDAAMHGVPFDVARIRVSAPPSNVSASSVLQHNRRAMDQAMRAYSALQQLVLCPSFPDPMGRQLGRASGSSSASSASARSRKGSSRSASSKSSGLHATLLFEHVSGVRMAELVKHCGPLSVLRWAGRRVLRDIVEAVSSLHA